MNLPTQGPKRVCYFTCQCNLLIEDFESPIRVGTQYNVDFAIIMIEIETIKSLNNKGTNF